MKRRRRRRTVAMRGQLKAAFLLALAWPVVSAPFPCLGKLVRGTTCMCLEHGWRCSRPGLSLRGGADEEERDTGEGSGGSDLRRGSRVGGVSYEEEETSFGTRQLRALHLEEDTGSESSIFVEVPPASPMPGAATPFRDHGDEDRGDVSEDTASSTKSPDGDGQDDREDGEEEEEDEGREGPDSGWFHAAVRSQIAWQPSLTQCVVPSPRPLRNGLLHLRVAPSPLQTEGKDPETTACVPAERIRKTGRKKDNHATGPERAGLIADQRQHGESDDGEAAHDAGEPGVCARVCVRVCVCV